MNTLIYLKHAKYCHSFLYVLGFFDLFVSYVPLVGTNLTTLNKRMEASVNDSISNLRLLNKLLGYPCENYKL